jgi:hypothetical protein
MFADYLLRMEKSQTEEVDDAKKKKSGKAQKV